MPFAISAGVKIYYEETAPAQAPSGPPILFLHEYSGDHRSWNDQVRHFARGWRCIVMANRGYPPSEVPSEEAKYGQELSNRDAIAVLDELGIAKAHVVGLSMGAFTALQLCMNYPSRIVSAVAASGGSGSHLTERPKFLVESMANADKMDATGKMPVETMAVAPTRVQLQNKDPRGWKEFVAHLAEHPAHAAAKTLRQVQMARPSLYHQEAPLKAVTTPVLLLAGDEDEPCLDVNLWLKRIMPTAQLALFPGSGHGINIEEPALFNALAERFIVSVERGSWRRRDPRAVLAGGVFTGEVQKD